MNTNPDESLKAGQKDADDSFRNSSPNDPAEKCGEGKSDLEIVLVDDLGNPIPEEEFHVEEKTSEDKPDEDKSVEDKSADEKSGDQKATVLHSGKLDKKGYALVKDIPVDTQEVNVVFPNREPSWWLPDPDAISPRIPRPDIVNRSLPECEWLEIEARDILGNPLSEERFSIFNPGDAPDGEPLFMGELDEEGFAQIDFLPEGTGSVEIIFQNRDETWWLPDQEPASVKPAISDIVNAELPQSNWLEIEARDSDGKPLAEELFSVFKKGDAPEGEVLYNGILDENGWAAIDIYPDGLEQVDLVFNNRDALWWEDRDIQPKTNG